MLCRFVVRHSMHVRGERGELTVSISIQALIFIQGLDFSDDEASNENKKGSNKSSKECQVKQKKVRKIRSKRSS